jgi:hypothetical protein
MEKLKVQVGGITKQLVYTERHSKGIFLVAENKAVKINCRAFDIVLDEAEEEHQIVQKITKLDKVGILTVRAFGEFIQFVILDYVDLEDLNRLISEVPRESKEALRTTYNLTKVNNLEKLDLLGSMWENDN